MRKLQFQAFWAPKAKIERGKKKKKKKKLGKVNQTYDV